VIGKPLMRLTCTEIATRVTVEAAAASTTPRSADRVRRANDALHEAAHVVVAAHNGERAAYVYIPTHDANGQLLVPKRGYQSPGQTHASRFSAPYQRDDLVTELEDATVTEFRLHGCIRRPRTQTADPLLSFAAVACAAALQRKRSVRPKHAMSAVGLKDDILLTSFDWA
jgi:hypothetical protein